MVMIVAYCCRTFIKLSAEPLPTSTMSSALHNTIAPLGPETFTHNTAIIPIIIACTKAGIIDGLVGAGASAMGGIVKWKRVKWEEHANVVMYMLRKTC